MTLPKRLAPEKMIIVTIGGNAVPISNLNNDIIEEFEVLYKMQLDAAELSYRMEVMSLAVKAKAASISEMINNAYPPRKPEVKQDVEEKDEDWVIPPSRRRTAKMP